MEIVREGYSFVGRDSSGKLVAEITFPQSPSNPDVVIADHTFTDPSLRGQGIAGQLVDKMVDAMKAEGKKIVPTCPYVVRKFQENPEKYDFIIAK